MGYIKVGNKVFTYTNATVVKATRVATREGRRRIVEAAQNLGFVWLTVIRVLRNSMLLGPSSVSVGHRPMPPHGPPTATYSSPSVRTRPY